MACMDFNRLNANLRINVSHLSIRFGPHVSAVLWICNVQVHNTTPIKMSLLFQYMAFYRGIIWRHTECL